MSEGRWTGPGAPPIVGGEELVARDLMERSRPGVKIFSGKTPDDVEMAMNAWLGVHPGVEIRQFFPVSVATAVAVAKSVAIAPKELQMNQCNHSYGSDQPHELRASDEKADSMAAVGIYYTYDEPKSAAGPTGEDQGTLL